MRIRGESVSPSVATSHVFPGGSPLRSGPLSAIDTTRAQACVRFYPSISITITGVRRFTCLRTHPLRGVYRYTYRSARVTRTYVLPRIPHTQRAYATSHYRSRVNAPHPPAYTRPRGARSRDVRIRTPSVRIPLTGSGTPTGSRKRTHLRIYAPRVAYTHLPLA